MVNIKFSVIIPVYNTDKYLEECILSVLNQTYKNFEIILVDDGSIDNSPKICDEYAEKYENIKVIHKKNGGEISARIAGNTEITGDYVLYIDADDMLRNDSLDCFAKYFNENNCDMIIFEASKYKTFSDKMFNLPLVPDKIYENSDISEIYDLILTSNKINSMCMKVSKKELIDKSFDDFEQFYSIRNGADAIMSLALIDNAQRIVYTDSIYYFYRINNSSVTSTYSDVYYESTKLLGVKRHNYSLKWFKEIIPHIYDYDFSLCYSTIKHEITNKTYSYLYHYKKIKKILSDEFYMNSYENSTLDVLPPVDRLILKLIMRFHIIILPIMFLYNVLHNVLHRLN